ncbi:MAG: cupredoxin domain-containing protein [Gemmatimonas sp.]|nr:cupredoxin domain-containing protein [Gemmatimonas sp.]
MSSAEIMVVVGAVAAIAWVNWYFFFAENRAVASAGVTGGVQEVLVRVEGGYDPSRIRVRRGEPVRMVFDRQETSSCSEEVVFPDFGIKKFLPAYSKTAVEFIPEREGTYEFTCGMSMLRGKIVVEEG